MVKLSNISTLRYKKFLIHIGCKCNRKKGSHEHYSRRDLTRPLTIQSNKKTVPEFIIHEHLRHLNMTRQEFIEIIDQL